MRHKYALGALVAGCMIVESFGAVTRIAAAPTQEEQTNRPSESVAVDGPVHRGNAYDLASSIETVPLRALVYEVLERNPAVARAHRQAEALMARAPQARAWAEPTAALTWFALPPETRVGSQRFSASVQQRLPRRGARARAEDVALFDAAAAAAMVEVARLDALTEARRLYHELAFLDARRAIVRAERLTLVRFEEAAQARYASGSGLQQETVRVQAQITRVDTRLLEIDEHAARQRAALNALRDRPADALLEIEPAWPPAEAEPASFDGTTLRRAARRHRPELVAADARIAAAEARRALVATRSRPDITVGVAYTVVERRDDAAARVAPPSGNGDDILALSGGFTLPVRKRRQAAEDEEARAWQWAAEAEKRIHEADIERSLGDLSARIPLLQSHWHLLETVLNVQAREALRSAEIAYSTGKLNAVDLLDAEVVLLEVQVAAARTRADWAVAMAQLERAVGRPLDTLDTQPEEDDGES